MPDGQVLEFTRVTKRFNDVTAVSDLTARIEPGAVTAFLGPNGAGKTTTLRILLGQVRATSGTATIGGVPYSELRHPLRTIGSVLEETVYRPRRSAARQLTIAAKANGIPLSRVDEVLSLVGLENAGDGRIGSFSLGMRQRLSVANALLGDPGALVFDEPANGLDPEGIRWMRLLMRRLADEGRTVLVSSHVLSEVEQVADNVLVLSKGRLVLSSGIEKLADPASGSVVVDAADRAALTTALTAAGFEIEVLRSGLTVRGGDAGRVGAIAAAAGIALSTLVQRGPTLEDVFIALVRGGTLSTPALTGSGSGEQTDAAAAAAGAEDAAGGTADAGEQDAGERDAGERDAGEREAVEEESAPQAAPVVGTAGVAAAGIAGAAAAAAEGIDVDDRAEDVDTSAPSAPESSDTDHLRGGSAGPSFDDILFGTATVEDSRGDDGQADSEDGPRRESDEDHSGVEFFAELRDGDSSTGEVPQVDGDAASEDAGSEDAGSEDAGSEDAGSEVDPRSAAVSSMLAAAARAYYEDEPRAYPRGTGPEPSDEHAAHGSEAADDSAHFSVASTGVIDQIAPDSAPEGDAGEAEDHDGEQRDGEHHEGEHQQGEHHEGEHHGGEHHEGERHDGEHHDGEHRDWHHQG